MSVPQDPNNDSIRHHLIPQVYMKAWGDNTSSKLRKSLKIIDCTDKNNLIVKDDSTINVGVIDFYNSLKAGMPKLKQAVTDEMFEGLNSYSIVVEDEHVTHTQRMNELFGIFDEWIIKYKDHIINSDEKTALKTTIQNQINNTIETYFARGIENKWHHFRENIKKVVATESHVPIFQKDLLLEMVVLTEHRSSKGNIVFEGMMKRIFSILEFDKIALPEDERYMEGIESAEDELKHRLRQNNIEKHMYKDADSLIQKMLDTLNDKQVRLHFIKGNSQYQQLFVTSDNPVINTEESIFMPITPYILCEIQKKVIVSRDSERYKIQEIIENKVNESNAVIVNSAKEFAILPFNHYESKPLNYKNLLSQS